MTLPADPTEFNKPKQTILADADLDGLGRAMLTLCHELWTVKDRMAVLEAVLEKHGIDAAAEIEAFQPDGALKDKLSQDGRAMVERFFEALSDT